MSTQTRQALLSRAQPDGEHTPGTMSASGFTALRALLDVLIPQPRGRWIDLAARIDKQLFDGEGDGWRHSELPPDADAYRSALDTLDAWSLAEHGRTFPELHSVQKENAVRCLAEGAMSVSNAEVSLLDAAQMRSWFDDLLADAVRLYMAHPETLGRIGYSGVANGGDGDPKSGFVSVGVGERESWEPTGDPDRIP